MPDFGMKVAKSFRDVEDGDRYQLFNTKYPVLKLFASGQGTLNTTAGNGGGVAEISHNLGYKPIAFAYGKWIPFEGTAVGSNYALWNRAIYQGLQVADIYRYYTDNNKLYISVDLSYLTDVNNYAFSYMYHIFYDEDTLA